MAIRENQLIDEAKERHAMAGDPLGAEIPSYVTPEFVREEIARGAPSSLLTSITLSSSL